MAHDARTTCAAVWVVDDDRGVRFVLATALRDAGYDVTAFDSAAAVLDALGLRAPPALLFTDVRMPGDDGLVLLDRLKAKHPALPVIVMSAYTDIASTAGAFRGGAQEFLSKPFDLDDAVGLAARVLQVRARDADDDAPEPSRTAAKDDESPALIGEAPEMQALFRAIGRLAQAPLGVLVTGETGTGKELVARALHRESPRARKPFVALNTAAIPSELLDSELFGHEAGAFTGAAKRHVGRFEQADGGTLFLDEIGDMPLPLQTRLLRVLAENEFFRVGGRELIRVDVRVVAATHQDLNALVAEGRFRADLLHRLDVVRLRLPPLRARRGDIGALAERFLRSAAAKFDATPKRLSAHALERLCAHAWPGNVRELENVCWRLAALAPGDVIAVDDLAGVFDGPDPMATSSRDDAAIGIRDFANASVGVSGDASVDARGEVAGETSGHADWERGLARWARARLDAGAVDLHAEARERFERALFDAALAHTGGHRSDAAAKLGLGRNTLTRKLGSTRGPRRER